MDVYPKDERLFPVGVPCNLTFGSLNTQVAEQANSRLRNIATQVAYMAQKNFLAHTKYFLYMCNAPFITKTSDMVASFS